MTVVSVSSTSPRPLSPLRAVVTGGATNIGRSITEAFLANGGRVVVGQPDVTIAAPLCQRYGERVIALPVDVGDPSQCRQFVDAAARALGGIDVLVNNAAITGEHALSGFCAIPPAHFDALMRVNVGGVLFCAQAAVPHLRAAGGGVIVNISSINAYRPQHHAAVYAATKAAVSSLTRSMARELAPDRIRVVAVAPGDIRVDTEQPLGPASGPADESSSPLGRGEPGDVAATVSFLCSPGARFVSGVTWLVDGGALA